MSKVSKSNKKSSIKIKKKSIKPKKKSSDEDIIKIEEDEDEFFNSSNFKEFDDIEYKIYDPDKFTNITHKEINIVPNNLRRTSDLITKYEYTEVVSIRAKQIENGSKYL